MGDLAWKRGGFFCLPEKPLRFHLTVLGTSGSGKSETLQRIAYGARKVYRRQIIYLDAKGETKREEEQSEDSAARFVASMQAAGAKTIKVFPALSYDGWKGTPAELKNRLLSVIDYSESPYYGDVAANVLDLALFAPATPRNSRHFLANLRYDRLKGIYQHDRLQYQRVLSLDKHLLQQVEMRYQVFFAAMAGQLDGTLDYTDADAVYLRVRGFTLRNEAPRLGRFLIYDFMHYIAERRRPGVRTMLIVDELNALRMREETSILFEQVRSFGGNLVISSQGYAGLGPHEYAERILDACSTYVLHACSDPGPVSKRAGKRFYLDISWSEDEEGIPRKHIRPRYDWRVPETAVIQQEEGQAYWIHRGRAQQVQTAQIPVAPEQVSEAWKEIRQQEDLQRQLLELEAQRRREQQAQKQRQKQRDQAEQAAHTPAPPMPTPAKDRPSPGTARPGAKNKTDRPTKAQPQQAKGSPPTPAPNTPSPDPSSIPSTPEPPTIPMPDPDDDEPDHL